MEGASKQNRIKRYSIVLINKVCRNLFTRETRKCAVAIAKKASTNQIFTFKQAKTLAFCALRLANKFHDFVYVPFNQLKYLMKIKTPDAGLMEDEIYLLKIIDYDLLNKNSI